MKKKIYNFLIIMFIIGISVAVLVSFYGINHLKNMEAQGISQKRVKEYNVILDNRKQFLDAFAKFISSSKPVIDGYLENNRSKIIDFVNPLYKNLYPNLLTEIHFFKKPAISFVNFSNLSKYNFSVAKARQDIVWINSSFSPSNHFYICRLYPGLRATYPIIKNDRLLGSVSFGIDIKYFKNYFDKIGANTSIYISDKKLKNFLLPKRYSHFKKLGIYKDFRVEGDVYKVDLSKKFQIIGDNLYTIIEIKDFFHQEMGFLVIKDNIKKYIHTVTNASVEALCLNIIDYLIMLGIIILIFNWLFTKMDEINIILENIEHKNFNKIPEKVEEKDELDSYKNSLIEVSQEIQSYISLLSDEVEKFSKKAYIDGLTKAFNRMFLEENQKEIVLKSIIKKSPLSVIMLDIDDFKKVNDTYGHDIGDLVLIELVHTIQKLLRKNDYLIRYGGEEFVIILQDTEIDSAVKVAEKIREEIEKIEITTPKNNFHFTISLGISHLINEEKLCNIIKRADEKLYKAKRNGKNRVEF